MARPRLRGHWRSRVVALAVVGVPLLASVTPGATAVKQPSAAPYALRLVSRSGAQAEVAVREFPCRPNQGCAAVFYPVGNDLSRISVVRPGERLRVTGLGGDPSGRLVVGVLPTACPLPLAPKLVASVGRIALGRRLRFIPLSADGRWTASLEPGFYFLSSSFTRRKANGDKVSHTGLLGILVSETRPFGTVAPPRPRC